MTTNRTNPRKSTGLRWFDGKKHVSYIRGGDYTHPGEEKAIEKALARFPKDKNRLILDVACGLGGTANFIQQNGWGKVVGFDIEEASIEYAKKTYPDIEFYVSDVIEVSKLFPHTKFDMICVFSSFLVFSDQKAALQQLRSIAKDDAKLVIYDYIDLLPADKNPLVEKGHKKTTFLPIRLENINELLKENGWECTDINRMDDEFKGWYSDFLDRIKSIKDEFIKTNGEEEYKRIFDRYNSFYEAFDSHSFGGCALYANNIPTLECKHSNSFRH